MLQAASRGDAAAVQRLINSADPSETSPAGNSAVHNAAQKGHGDVLRLLLPAMAASVNGSNSAGCTPLHYAAQNGHVEAGEMLLDAGADLERGDRMGSTALHHAVERLQPEMVKMLVSRGANRDAKDKDGETPRDMAGRVKGRHKGSIAVALEAIAPAQASAAGSGQLESTQRAGRRSSISDKNRAAVRATAAAVEASAAQGTADTPTAERTAAAADAEAAEGTADKPMSVAELQEELQRLPRDLQKLQSDERTAARAAEMAERTAQQAVKLAADKLEWRRGATMRPLEMRDKLAAEVAETKAALLQVNEERKALGGAGGSESMRERLGAVRQAGLKAKHEAALVTRRLPEDRAELQKQIEAEITALEAAQHGLLTAQQVGGQAVNISSGVSELEQAEMGSLGDAVSVGEKRLEREMQRLDEVKRAHAEAIAATQAAEDALKTALSTHASVQELKLLLEIVGFGSGDHAEEAEAKLTNRLRLQIVQTFRFLEKKGVVAPLPTAKPPGKPKKAAFFKQSTGKLPVGGSPAEQSISGAGSPAASAAEAETNVQEEELQIMMSSNREELLEATFDEPTVIAEPSSDEDEAEEESSTNDYIEEPRASAYHFDRYSVLGRVGEIPDDPNDADERPSELARIHSSDIIKMNEEI